MFRLLVRRAGSRVVWCLTYSADDEGYKVRGSVGEDEDKMNDCQDSEYSREGVPGCS